MEDPLSRGDKGRELRYRRQRETPPEQPARRRRSWRAERSPRHTRDRPHYNCRSVSTTEVQPLFTAEEIAARVKAIATDIRHDAGDAEIFLLAILKGSSCFVADLLRAIPGDVSYGFIDVVRDEIDTETASALEIDFLSYTNVTGRHVFVLKDVVSTGIIETYLLAQLRTHGPASLHLVALLDRTEARTVDLVADYRGFEVREGAYVGYGLEIGSRHGNLPFIGKVGG